MCCPANREWENTEQEAFRVVMAQNDASQMYVTGARSWDNGYGTQVPTALGLL